MDADTFPDSKETTMALRRLAKSAESTGSGRCPALYATDDAARMVAQVKTLTGSETSHLLEVGMDEVAGSIPTETVFRAVACYASEHGDKTLATAIDEFLTRRGM
jgi:hypothetical protein